MKLSRMRRRPGQEYCSDEKNVAGVFKEEAVTVSVLNTAVLSVAGVSATAIETAFPCPRRVRFYSRVTIILIPSVLEYKAANLHEDLWWNTALYDSNIRFQQHEEEEI